MPSLLPEQWGAAGRGSSLTLQCVILVTVTSFLQTAPGCLHLEHHARYTVHSNGRGGLEGNPGAASHSVKVENLPGA